MISDLKMSVYDNPAFFAAAETTWKQLVNLHHRDLDTAPLRQNPASGIKDSDLTEYRDGAEREYRGGLDVLCSIGQRMGLDLLVQHPDVPGQQILSPRAAEEILLEWAHFVGMERPATLTGSGIHFAA